MRSLVDPAGLQRVVDMARGLKVDFAEVYAEYEQRANVLLDNSQVERAAGGAEGGVGVRMFRGSAVAYTIVNSLDPERIMSAVRETGSLLRRMPEESTVVLPAAGPADTAGPPAVPGAPSLGELAAGLQEVDRVTRGVSPLVTQVTAEGQARLRTIWIASSDGVLTSDVQHYTRVILNVVATSGSRREANYYTPGRAANITRFFSLHQPEEIGRKGAHMALTLLDARPAPTGPMTVVVGNGRGGALIHEACVHPLEGDFVSRDNSVYRGLLGAAIASPGVTVVDDAGAPGSYPGTIRVDDEGCGGRHNVLVENGRLVSYLTDAVTASRLRHRRTGNGRRQSYRHLPMPRMTNTYIAPGKWDPEEIVRNTERGILATHVAGGEVNQVTGEFVFTVSEGYLIENGRVTAPIQRTTLVGSGPEVLKQIDMVGNDLHLASASCVKNGQVVEVGVGQPTIRVREMVVGGTVR